MSLKHFTQPFHASKTLYHWKKEEKKKKMNGKDIIQDTNAEKYATKG